ncbi:hypothetical protein AB0E63_42870 [Kribbella sp. NPDC026596]|uniref:hypothetical protein n=1 Tax=Kribbella sp. NPDC026596 TaxID=3155122 RepID=UPI0033F25E59
MKRLLVQLTVFLVALLTIGPAIAAAQTMSAPATVQAYAYDGHHTSAHLDMSDTERAPPVYDHPTACGSFDSRSHGRTRHSRVSAGHP